MFEFIRSLMCPFETIASFVPSGIILDVGAGHGTFARILAQKGNRQVLGIDPSDEKVKLAQKKALKAPSLHFKKAYLETLPEKNFDAITIIDVLYLFPPSKKEIFLKEALKRLKKGGKLLLVINGKSNKLAYYLLLLEETLMVKVFKYTHSDDHELHFWSSQQYKKLLTKVGFKVEKVLPLQSALRYPPHELLIAKKL
jgi:2-polyprenyl-3-methyl-5-hydroxy-6-metoxy-1,4-benzoquinol methylase